MQAWESRTDLRSLIENDEDIMKTVTTRDLDKAFDLKAHFTDIDRTFKAVGL